MHERVVELLAREGATLAASRLCLHHRQASSPSSPGCAPAASRPRDAARRGRGARARPERARGWSETPTPISGPAGGGLQDAPDPAIRPAFTSVCRRPAPDARRRQSRRRSRATLGFAGAETVGENSTPLWWPSQLGRHHARSDLHTNIRRRSRPRRHPRARRRPAHRRLHTNPTLMRKAGLTDYAASPSELLEHVTEHPISFEVFADEVGRDAPPGARDRRPGVRTST